LEKNETSLLMHNGNDLMCPNVQVFRLYGKFD